MRQMLFGTLLMLGLTAFAQAPAPFQNIKATGVDEVASLQGQGRGTVLFSTFGGIVNPSPVTVSSQSFLDLSPFFTAAADDFTITDLAWTIDGIEVRGGYEFGSGPAQSVNVYILGNSAGLPDTTNLSAGAIYAAENLTPGEPTPGDFIIDLPGDGVTLQGGTYWLVVQANMAIGSGGQWNWTESADGADSGNFFGNKSAWLQEASAFFAGGACTTWGNRVDTCGVTNTVGANPEFDLAFELTGDVLTAGAMVDPTVLNTTEDGSPVDYNVYLTAPPAGGETVTVTPASTDVTEGTVSGALNFTSANWNIPQTVTVTPGASGDGNDGDVAYTINNTVSGNMASGYDAATAPSVSSINVNIDGVKVITVDPATGLSVSEDGTVTDSFDIALTQIPTAGTVSVDVNGDANTQVSLSPGGPFTPMVSAVMTTTTPVTVYVQGIDNDIDSNDTPFTVSTDPAVAAGDPGYNGVNPPDVSGNVLDDDTAGISVTGGPLSTDETGLTDSFDVVLDSEPTADVTVPLVSSDPSEASVPASITFTPANWDTPQTVTVTGEDDDIADGPIDYQINTQPASSSDPFYDGLDAADVSGTNADEGEMVGITVSPTSGLTTAEADVTGSASFTVVLDSEPLFDVNVPFTSDDTTEGLIGTAMGGPFSDTLSLTFTPANWDTPQTVWIQGQDDVLRADGDIVYNIVGGDPTSNDIDYNNLDAAAVGSVEVTNLDDVGEVCAAPVTCVPVDNSTVIVTGEPGCIVDLANLNGSTNPVDWSVVVDDVTIGIDGTATIVVPGGLQDDQLYGITASDGSVLLGSVFQTVPTLGEWGLIVFVSLLAMAAIYMMRRRRLMV